MMRNVPVDRGATRRMTAAMVRHVLDAVTQERVREVVDRAVALAAAAPRRPGLIARFARRWFGGRTGGRTC
jgi:hypothetical protein